ncbi:hypothetical protein N7481_002912 [Penicillium waksmanii]|uniref:uncharacterized protein n=1 Tax=Penicillium waksmanii TaxID=69791 RepID=UPI002549858D|nr:uncharacterized protein N7481_002912 [Penicillium waksmanii]KAJ5987702.1 hypothetical protein N7481_002912 [Penicillium waksmanii]
MPNPTPAKVLLHRTCQGLAIDRFREKKQDQLGFDATRRDLEPLSLAADGAPKIMCQRCGTILKHPHTVNPQAKGKVQYPGISTMQKHLMSEGRE